MEIKKEIIEEIKAIKRNETGGNGTRGLYKLRLYILLPILASIKLYAQPKKKIPKKNVGKAKIRFLGSLKRLN